MPDELQKRGPLGSTAKIPRQSTILAELEMSGRPSVIEGAAKSGGTGKIDKGIEEAFECETQSVLFNLSGHTPLFAQYLRSNGMLDTTGSSVFVLRTQLAEVVRPGR